MSNELTEPEIKIKIARMCVLCEQLWPAEWTGKYTGSREDFRDWLNEKTVLSQDHILDKSSALIAWVEKLETLV